MPPKKRKNRKEKGDADQEVKAILKELIKYFKSSKSNGKSVSREEKEVVKEAANLVKINKPKKTKKGRQSGFSGREPVAPVEPKEPKERKPKGPKPKPKPKDRKWEDYQRDVSYEEQVRDATMRSHIRPIPYDINPSQWASYSGQTPLDPSLFTFRRQTARDVPLPWGGIEWERERRPGQRGPRLPPAPSEYRNYDRLEQQYMSFETSLVKGAAYEVINLWRNANNRSWVGIAKLEQLIEGYRLLDMLYQGDPTLVEIFPLIAVPTFKNKPSLANSVVKRRIEEIDTFFSRIEKQEEGKLYSDEDESPAPPGGPSSSSASSLSAPLPPTFPPSSLPPPPKPPSHHSSKPPSVHSHHSSKPSVGEESDEESDEESGTESGAGRRGSGLLLPELRNERPPAVRELIDKYGTWRITKLVISKRPIPQALEKLANIITFGYFEKNKKIANVEKYMHLYSDMHISNGRGDRRVALLEKNERVDVRYDNRPVPGQQDMNVRIPYRLTVADYIRNGEDYALKHNLPLYIYDAVTANCQLFQEWMLKGNRLWRPDMAKFILQDVDVAVAPWLRKFLKGVTDLKAKLDIIFYGRGSGRRRKRLFNKRRGGRAWLTYYDRFKNYL